MEIYWKYTHIFIFPYSYLYIPNLPHTYAYTHIHMCTHTYAFINKSTYSKTTLYRPTIGSTLNDPFREVVGLES